MHCSTLYSSSTSSHLAFHIHRRSFAQRVGCRQKHEDAAAPLGVQRLAQAPEEAIADAQQHELALEEQARVLG